MFNQAISPRYLLHLEGLLLFIGSIALYAHEGYSGWQFVVLLLVFDVSLVGYWVNPQVGSWLYNAGHTYLAPLILIAVASLLNWSFGFPLALIWVAHISMDRAAGFGLKYPTQFNDTHLQRL